MIEAFGSFLAFISSENHEKGFLSAGDSSSQPSRIRRTFFPPVRTRCCITSFIISWSPSKCVSSKVSSFSVVSFWYCRSSTKKTMSYSCRAIPCAHSWQSFIASIVFPTPGAPSTNTSFLGSLPYRKMPSISRRFFFLTMSST